jgi:hypothetical protein
MRITFDKHSDGWQPRKSPMNWSNTNDDNGTIIQYQCYTKENDFERKSR